MVVPHPRREIPEPLPAPAIVDVAFGQAANSIELTYFELIGPWATATMTAPSAP